MRDKRAKEKITIKQIFSEHWIEFKKTRLNTIPEEIQKSVEEAVEKMLGCGDPKSRYAKYVCTDCGEQKIVGFTCRSYAVDGK